MKELILTIVTSLVDHPQDVRIEQEENETSILYQVSVHSEDMGRVIGKQGRVAKALRTVVYAAAAKEKKRVNIEFV